MNVCQTFAARRDRQFLVQNQQLPNPVPFSPRCARVKQEVGFRRFPEKRRHFDLSVHFKYRTEQHSVPIWLFIAQILGGMQPMDGRFVSFLEWTDDNHGVVLLVAFTGGLGRRFPGTRVTF